MITELCKEILWPQNSLDKHRSPVEHFLLKTVPSIPFILLKWIQA